jgi:ferredoxin-NADP reductase
MAQATVRYKLKWAKLIAPSVRHLAFVREDESYVAFTAGQFITLHIPGPSKILHRSYSIANMPGKDNIIEIAVSFVEGGVASNLLFNMQPGDSIDAVGPYGLFVLKKEDKPKRYILIGTGTGVSPYRSMLDDIKMRLMHEDSDLEVALLMGVRNPTELLFGQDFEDFAKAHANFNFHACYSRETRDVPRDFEIKGHVQDVFPILNLDPEHDIIYLCGNPFMIDDAFLKLTEMGFDKKRVRREKYLFAH